MKVQPDNEFHAAFEHAPIGMAIVSTEGRFLRANNQLCESLGYTNEELCQLNFQSITHPDDLDADVSQVQKLLKGDLNAYHMEKRYFHRSGKIIWANLGVAMIRDEHGKPLHFVSHIQDITEFKKTIEVLNEREHQLIQVVEATRDGIWDWQIREGTEYLTNRFWEILGLKFTDSEAKKNWKSYMFAEDLKLFESQIANCIQSKDRQTIYQELRFQNLNRTVWVICRASVVEWDERARPLRLMGSFTDVTELRMAQESLLANAKMVALGEMAGGIAHEINNPLTIIKGHADRL